MNIVWRNDTAVSSTIGTILLVAVTVILAALVATLAISMFDHNLQKQKAAAVTVSQFNDEISVTYMGGTDDPTLSWITIQIPPHPETYITIDEQGTLGTDLAFAKKPDVGAVMVPPVVGTAEQDRVIVTGHFDDGSDFVLIDIFV